MKRLSLLPCLALSLLAALAHATDSLKPQHAATPPP